MTDGYLLNLRTFREVRDDKAQALKPLEEAAEAFGAWQRCDDIRLSPTMTARVEHRDDLIDECLDTVMTLAEVLDVIAENPRRFIEQYEMYREEVIRLGGKL